MNKKMEVVIKLVILVLVLGAIDVFFNYNLVPTVGVVNMHGCVGNPGYSCSNIDLSNNGTLNFTFGQQTGSAIYNLEFACATTASSDGLPNPLSAFKDTANYLQNDSVVTVTDLPCYNSGGVQLGTQPVGIGFSGYIWLNYTNFSSAPSANNTWQTAKVATVELNVT